MLCFGRICASPCALNVSAALQDAYIIPFPTEVVRAIRAQGDEAYVSKIVCYLHVMVSNPHPPPWRAPHLHHFHFTSPQPIKPKEASNSDFTIEDVMLWPGMCFSLRSQCKRCSAGRLQDDVRWKIKYNKLRNLIQRKIRVAKGHFPLISNWKKIYDPYEKCNLFNTHFASVSTLPDEKLRNVNLPNFSFITDQRLQPLVAERFDVYSVLSYLNPAKCKGFKNLPNCLLKSCSQSLVTPLSLLFNFTLASEQFPLQWKTASILPFHKKGSHYDVTNHWPIALLPSLSKVFEKLVHKHLYSYLESRGLLNHRNSGFRKNHSTLTSLLKTTHDIYLAHDHNLSSHIVFLDISKAFDRVVHTNLLLKLKQIGIVGSLLNLITSYLENRSQVVHSNGSTSDIQGVSQLLKQSVSF